MIMKVGLISPQPCKIQDLYTPSPLDKNMPLAARTACIPYSLSNVYKFFQQPKSPPGAFFAPAEQALSGWTEKSLS